MHRNTFPHIFVSKWVDGTFFSLNRRIAEVSAFRLFSWKQDTGPGLRVVGFDSLTKQANTETDKTRSLSLHGFARKPWSNYRVLFLILITRGLVQPTYYNTSHTSGLKFMMIKIVVSHFAVHPVDPVQAV